MFMYKQFRQMAPCTLIRTPKGVGGAGEMLYLCTVETFSLNEAFTTVR